MKEDKPAGRRDSDIGKREAMERVRTSPVASAGGAAAAALRGEDVRPASEITPAREDAYWRDHYASRPYAGPGLSYEDLGPAYRHAIAVYMKHRGERSFEDAERELALGWDLAKGQSRLSWDEAMPVARDAWQRLVER